MISLEGPFTPSDLHWCYNRCMVNCLEDPLNDFQCEWIIRSMIHPLEGFCKPRDSHTVVSLFSLPLLIHRALKRNQLVHVPSEDTSWMVEILILQELLLLVYRLCKRQECVWLFNQVPLLKVLWNLLCSTLLKRERRVNEAESTHLVICLKCWLNVPKMNA